ncbi:MAG: 16S rRNA processing protein RimM [Clostridiales bacterium]|nr:16S rRNA processing protein RimM [Clostridiales bacterium]
MQDTLKIGLVLKPQGIKGQLKVQPLTDDINRYKNLKEIIIDQKVHKVTGTIISGQTVFIDLFGVNDRDTAETFRGKFLHVKREDAIALEEGRYFVVDLIGCDVITKEQGVIGKIIDIFSSRTDVITVKCSDGRILRFPFLKDLVEKVDIEKKQFIVLDKRLSEVSCYEN